VFGTEAIRLFSLFTDGVLTSNTVSFYRGNYFMIRDVRSSGSILHIVTQCSGRLSKLPIQFTRKRTPWPESESELCRPSDRRLSAKLVPTFSDRGVPRGQRNGSLRPYSRIPRPDYKQLHLSIIDISPLLVASQRLLTMGILFNASSDSCSSWLAIG
jgi:hypothetical protein